MTIEYDFNKGTCNIRVEKDEILDICSSEKLYFKFLNMVYEIRTILKGFYDAPSRKEKHHHD